jgi:hypothetical protein
MAKDIVGCIDDTSGAMVCIYGSNNTFADDFSTATALVLQGGHEQILQYGGDLTLTIYRFNASDTLSLYGQFVNANGSPLKPGTPLTAASLRPDGHGGWNLPLAAGGGTIDFVNTREATILAANITASVRGFGISYARSLC